MNKLTQYFSKVANSAPATSTLFTKIIQPVFITLLPSLCLAEHICTDLFKFITDSINIEYNIIEAVCYNTNSDTESTYDSSGSGSGDTIPINTIAQICHFNCTDYSLNCKGLSSHIYNALYYTDELITWTPEQFESICLAWNKSIPDSSNITATNTTMDKNVSIGVLTIFGIVCAGVIFVIGKVCYRR